MSAKLKKSRKSRKSRKLQKSRKPSYRFMTLSSPLHHSSHSSHSPSSFDSPSSLSRYLDKIIKTKTDLFTIEEINIIKQNLNLFGSRIKDPVIRTICKICENTPIFLVVSI